MRTVYALLSLIICFGPALPANAQRHADPAVERRFFEHYRAKNYRAAFTLADSLAQTDTTLSPAFVLRGIAHEGAGRLEKASEDYVQAIRLDPMNMEAFNAAGMLLYSLQRYEEAERILSLALARIPAEDSNYYSLINNRGGTYLMRRQWEAAYADFSEALKLQPNDVGLLTNISITLFEGGRPDEGMDMLMRLYRQDTTSVGAISNLAYRHGEAGRYAEAIRFCDKAIALSKDEGVLGLAYSNRSHARTKSGDPTGGLADAEQGIRYYPGNSYVYRNKALALLSLGRKAEACAALDFAAKQGFATTYGGEVTELRAKHCR